MRKLFFAKLTELTCSPSVLHAIFEASVAATHNVNMFLKHLMLFDTVHLLKRLSGVACDVKQG